MQQKYSKYTTVMDVQHVTSLLIDFWAITHKKPNDISLTEDTLVVSEHCPLHVICLPVTEITFSNNVIRISAAEHYSPQNNLMEFYMLIMK
jgi:hypothetical protein